MGTHLDKAPLNRCSLHHKSQVLHAAYQVVDMTGVASPRHDFYIHVYISKYPSFYISSFILSHATLSYMHTKCRNGLHKEKIKVQVFVICNMEINTRRPIKRASIDPVDINKIDVDDTGSSRKIIHCQGSWLDLEPYRRTSKNVPIEGLKISSEPQCQNFQAAKSISCMDDYQKRFPTYQLVLLFLIQKQVHISAKKVQAMHNLNFLLLLLFVDLTQVI